MDAASHGARSTDETTISRRWIIALVTLLMTNVSLVTWAMSSRANPRTSSPDLPAVAELAGPTTSKKGIPATGTAARAPATLADAGTIIDSQPIAASVSVAPANTQPAAGAAAAVNDSSRPKPELVVQIPEAGQRNTDPPKRAATAVAPTASFSSSPENLASAISGGAQEVLTIVNPRLTGGPVHYAVDGDVFCLQPGEYHQLASAERRRIEFDRGEDFGFAEHHAQEGTYVFEVCQSGWALRQADRSQAVRLVEACQPISAGR